MTRFEEKLYLQSVFDAIDSVYNMKKPQKHSTYEERLRASFSKLLIPDWYNHDYTSTNGLRKTKSHGHVPRVKRTANANSNQNNNNNNNSHNLPHSDDTPDTSHSSSVNSPHLSNGGNHQSYRHRSTSRSWSERAPIRRDSTTSSYDTSGSVINGRRSATSNGSSSYAPGVQRVAQSSAWYKPRVFAAKSNGNGTANGHLIEAPKPLPRCSKIDQDRLHCTESSTRAEHVRCPLKPRAMAQLPPPPAPNSPLNTSADVTLVQQSPTNVLAADKNASANLVRADSLKSVSSDAESYRSAVAKNLIGTDSSSYASVSERCMSPSTASYHTARAGDTSSSSSVAGYETPTPQLDDDNVTLSVHSSLSDLSHAETLEPSVEDLDIAAVSMAEQKSIIIPSVASGMEQSPLPTITSTPAAVDYSTTIESRPIESRQWYDGSVEAYVQHGASDVREIPNDEVLREVDINAVGDEFFLFSPPDSQASNGAHTNQCIRRVESPTQAAKRIFTMEDNAAGSGFHVSSTNDPFGFDDHHANHSSVMITNLDDVLVDDDDSHLNGSARRPIQEDILYEVEHENSFSDHSQNTSSIIPTDDKSSNRFGANIDYLTATDHPTVDAIREALPIVDDKQAVASKAPDNNTVLPIYTLPPLFTTSKSQEPPTSLHIDTSDSFDKWDSVVEKYSHLTSPSAYTSKIRHRHYSVGSYYDHKTTTVTLHPNHSMYLIGSAPVSPLSRTSTTSSESHYHLHRYASPISYDNVSTAAMRRPNPFLDCNTYAPFVSTFDYRRTTDYRSSSLNREDKSRTITYTSPKLTSKSVERTIPIIAPERMPPAPPSVTSPASARASTAPFTHYEVPVVHARPVHEVSLSPPPLPARPSLFEQESSFIRRTIIQRSPTTSPRTSTFHREPSPPPVRPKTSRGRVRTPSPPARAKPQERAFAQNIYQEIDSNTLGEDHYRTPNADLQFIRGAIERVFHFHGESTDTTSESSTHYEEVMDGSRRESKRASNQYPAVEAIQRFYTHKPSAEPVTNLDDVVVSHSTATRKTTSRSIPVDTRKTGHSKTKSSHHERASSDEVDDTLNDIEDVDSHDEKLKRRTANHSSSLTSDENSPVHSSEQPSKSKATSQHTQTSERQKPSCAPYPILRASVPPIDIVTDMVVEGEEVVTPHNGEMHEDMEDMVIFYDDIEIVENFSSCSSESESTSSVSSAARHYSHPTAPPPIPARTLKPNHLLSNHHRRQQQQQQQQSPSTTTSNRTYELEKAVVRKKFDVNSVNDMINRTDYNVGPSAAHRHPSARHFVGKLNSDDSSSQSVATNGHRRSSAKTVPISIPVRSASALPHDDKSRSAVADTSVLVKQLQNSLSRNSLHSTQVQPKTLSTSSKDLRAFVSSTYSPTDENTIDDNGTVHVRARPTNPDEQVFKRQARLSKSFHNVSEYNGADLRPSNDSNAALKTQPSKSVENNLDHVSQTQTKPTHLPLKLTSVVTSTSFSALPNSEDHARLLSMKWYTGQVSENSEICYNNTHHLDAHDLLAGYIAAHSNPETQALFARLQASNDARIHAALDDIRSRVAQFDASKTQEDIHTFMRYLESRLRDLSHKKPASKSAVNDVASNGHAYDVLPSRSRTNSISKENPVARQFGRQQIRSSSSMANGQPPTPPRRTSQSGANPGRAPGVPSAESPVVFDEMLNTVLGLPKKGVATLPQTFPVKREKPAPFIQPQITSTTTTTSKNGRDVGKRLFESGTYKDPRLLYDGPKRKEKEEQPLETSV